MLDKMKRIFELQNKMKAVKKDLESALVEVEAEDGRIKIVIAGDQKIRSLEIAQELMNAENKDSLPLDLMDCFNQAIKKSQQLAASKMQQATGINIPDL